ncbi:aryl hydrocarbon receptor-like, partial [Diretmus argenteus]
ALKNQPLNGVTSSSHHDNSRTMGLVDRIPEGELLLQALNGFVLVVAAEGTIFFSSHTIQDYLGFHQTDVMQQRVFDLIHTEDQQEFRRNLHWALNPPMDPRPPTDPPADDEDASTTSCLLTYDPDQLPPENSSFLERSFVCRFRCLLDNSSGFLAMNVQGRLKFLHGQNQREGAARPQLALFAIATPVQPPAILEIRTRNMIFRTKHKLDFTPMACDAKGKIVLGYTEAELRVRGSGYQFIHAADMLYCAENHVRMMKTGESGLTVFRLLTKENRWKWVQANARLVYKNGQPDYIIATQRPLGEEEGGEHLQKRSMHLPFTFATGEALLYHTSYPMHGFPDSLPGKAKKGRLDKTSTDHLHPNSLLGALMSQDQSVYVCQSAMEPRMSYHSSLFSEQQEDTHGVGGFLGGDVVSNGLMLGHNSEMSSYDPLLATLDSLTLDGDELCSNSELFSALENMGLNAEDLELLLLDERMIQVELDPNHIPTLSDLLTNNEILSYIHDSLESGTKGEETGDGGGLGSPTYLPTPPSTQSNTHQPLVCPTPAPHPALPNNRQPKQPPFIQLSQQMQQHISTAQRVKAQSWSPHSLSQPTMGTNILTEVPNGHWVAPMENHGHRHPQTLLQVCQLNREHKHLNQLLDPNQQWQLQQDQLPLHLQSLRQLKQSAGDGDAKRLWPNYQDQLQLGMNGTYIPNGHAAFSQSTEVGHVDYSMADAPSIDAVLMNGATHYQGMMSATETHQLPGHQKHQQQQQTQVPPSCLPQSATSELEQLLALPPLEASAMFSTTVNQDAPHSK